MSYELSHKKLDIGGPKGNVFAIVGIAADLVKQIEGAEIAKEWTKEIFNNDSYESVLREVIAKTGITLVSDRILGIDATLYTVERQNNYL